MNKRLYLLLIVFLGYQNSLFSYSKLVEYSEASDVIEIAEQLSEWHPSLPKDILTFWRTKFGELSSTDRSYLSRYRDIRKKLVLKNSSASKADQIFGELSPTYDYFTYSFYSSSSVSQALKKLSKKLPKSDLEELSRFFKHFLPKISQLVSESTAFRQKSKELQERLKKNKSSRILKELERFVAMKSAKMKDVKARLVWWPKTSESKLEVKGKYVLIRHHPLENFDKLKASEILGALIDSYLSTLSPNFKNNFTKTFGQKCPGREKEFHDSFVAVYKDIKSDYMADRKSFSLFKSWAQNPFVNQYSKLLYVLIEEEEKKKQKMGGSFAHDAASLCSEIHQLAVSPSL